MTNECKRDDCAKISCSFFRAHMCAVPQRAVIVPSIMHMVCGSCGSFVRAVRAPIKIVHARKKCQRNKSSASTSNAPIFVGVFNAHQGVLGRSVWSHCWDGILFSCPMHRCAARSCWWVTKYFINVLSHFSQPSPSSCSSLSIAICVSFSAFVSVSVAVWVVCSSLGDLFWSSACSHCYLN